MANRKKVYSVSLDPETMRLVDEVADSSGLKRSSVIDMTLRAALGSDAVAKMVSMLADLTRFQSESGAGFADGDPLTDSDLADSSGVVPGVVS